MIIPSPDLISRCLVPVAAKPESPIKLSVVAKYYKKGEFLHHIGTDADDYDLCSIDTESDEECPVENPASENSIFYRLTKDIDLKFYKIYGEDETNDWKVEYLIEDFENDPEDFRNRFDDLSPGEYTIDPIYRSWNDWEGTLEVELENVIVEKINMPFWKKLIEFFKAKRIENA